VSAYYNEFDPFAAAWLRELIKAGHIAPGEVDERSIEDVQPVELREFTQCHFFSGIGVWSYALRQAGWPDDRPVWTGSCPCQPFSAAGKRGGTADERHLWPALFHLLRECKPATFFGEQVASKDGLAWFDTVQADLEGSQYTVGAADLCSAGFGAPHIRQRLYFVGSLDYSPNPRHNSARECDGRPSLLTTRPEQPGIAGGLEYPKGEQVGIPGCPRQPRETNGFWAATEWIKCVDNRTRPIEPGTFPLAHGATNRVGKLRGYGNALTAEVAKGFIEAFLEVEREAVSEFEYSLPWFRGLVEQTL
jgi:DNA (cytosine-5)-methyltransferase 1